MRSMLITIFLICLTSITLGEEKDIKISVYSNSTMYYGTEMKVDFFLNEIKKTPACDFCDSKFPLPQLEAMTKALKWAKEKFDPTKNWKVQEISLKFISFDAKYCVYIVQLQPGDDMQSLPIGILMDGKIIPPKKKLEQP